MARGVQGPLQAVTETFDGTIGEYNQAFADFPPTQLTTDEINCFQILIQCDPASAANAIVGNATGQYIALRPGESLTLPIGDPSDVYIQGDVGIATVNWMAVT
jgi:hypothetical protein